MVSARHLVGASVGLLADRALGEPPDDVHPVAAFGQLMGEVEDRLWADRRDRGVVFAGTGVLLGRDRVGRGIDGDRGGRGGGRAHAPADGERGGRAPPRRRPGGRGAALPALVGRDPSELDRRGVVAAVVESVAENTVDAVVAPALWGAAFGAPGALGHRAINTLDAMVGHHRPRYERFGWASARADDVANWVPARATAALVALARPGRAAQVLEAVHRGARHHPSPNAGVAEAAFAGALGVELGGPLRYGERAGDRLRGRGARSGGGRSQARPRGRETSSGCWSGCSASAPACAGGGDDPCGPARRPPRAEGPRLARALGIEVDAVLDLSQSLNPLAPDVAPLVVRAAEGVRRYPEPAEATEALAAALGVDPGRVLLTNGGAEAIALVARPSPSGVWTTRSSRSTPGTWSGSIRPGRGGARTRTTRPGRWPTPRTGRRSGTRPSIRWPRGGGRGATPTAAPSSWSLTKLFACPGLRIGYVLGPDEVLIDRLRRRQPRCRLVNALALAVVPALLAVADLSDWSARVAGLRRDLVQALASVGLEALPSSANYVLVPRAPGVRERLWRPPSRCGTPHRSGSPNGIRVAVPDAAGLDRLVSALRDSKG